MLRRALILLAACHASPAPPRAMEPITIERDDWGIAHVHGATETDAVLGMIYAQAEDNFAQIENNYLAALGRLERYRPDGGGGGGGGGTAGAAGGTGQGVALGGTAGAACLPMTLIPLGGGGGGGLGGWVAPVPPCEDGGGGGALQTAAGAGGRAGSAVGGSGSSSGNGGAGGAGGALASPSAGADGAYNGGGGGGAAGRIVLRFEEAPGQALVTSPVATELPPLQE